VCGVCGVCGVCEIARDNITVGVCSKLRRDKVFCSQISNNTHTRTRWLDEDSVTRG
jgi:hypothetical protein